MSQFFGDFLLKLGAPLLFRFLGVQKRMVCTCYGILKIEFLWHKWKQMKLFCWFLLFILWVPEGSSSLAKGYDPLYSSCWGVGMSNWGRGSLWKVKSFYKLHYIFNNIRQVKCKQSPWSTQIILKEGLKRGITLVWNKVSNAQFWELMFISSYVRFYILQNF